MSWFQWALSTFVVYHLAAVLVTPLLLPPYGERMGAWVRAYVATFEFTNLWEFFAPNPAVPVLISWEAAGADGGIVARGVWPKQPLPGALADEEMRSLAALYFMIGSDTYIEKMMTPYLCAQDERFRSVRLWKETLPVRSMAEVASTAVPLLAAPDRKFVAHSFCEIAERRS